MKKTILFIACIALTAGAEAQVKYGVKAGLNLSSTSSGKMKNVPLIDGVTYDEPTGGETLPSFHIGVYGNRSFNNYLGMQVEALFSMQGAQNLEGALSGKLLLNYINFPILLDVKPIPELSIFVGGQWGFNIYKALKTIKIMEDYVDINTFDCAGVFGLQYTASNHLTIGARYNIGLNSIIKISDEGNDEKVSISGFGNRVLQLSVGYTF